MNRTTSLLRWPLWSWRNLSITTAALLLTLAGIGHLVGSPPSSASSPATSPATSPAPAHSASTAQGDAAPRPPTKRPSPMASASEPSRQPTTAAGAAQEGDAAATGTPGTAAVAFLRAWARPDLPPAKWQQGIHPLVTPELARALSATDPNRVPATTVAGSASNVRTQGRRAEATVNTDGGPVDVRLQRAGQRWLVTDIEPTQQPPGAPTPDLKPSEGKRRGG